MRICLVNREFAPLWGAGIGTYAAQMARAWAGAGHEVHVLGVNHPDAAREGARLFPGVGFHDVDPPLEADERVLWRSDVARRSQAVRRTLARLHAAHPFDYIEFPEYFAEGAMAIRGAACMGELAGATLGVRLHSPDRLCRVLNADPAFGWNRLLTDRLEMESIALADVVISPTASLLDWCRAELERAGGAMRGHAAVVPYPFDMGELSELGEGVEAAGDPARGPEILYFGRLERRKGVDLLIGAFQRLATRGMACSLRLVGGDTATGPGRTSMREHLASRLPRELRDRVAFEDRRERAALGPLIRRVAAGGGLCCFPSRWENFPNVVLEAMALGAPVVCADSSGMAEIVEHGRSGLLFGAGDEARLADALELMLSEHTRRAEMARAARERIAALCDPASVVRATIEAIERGGVRRGDRMTRLPKAGHEPAPAFVWGAASTWQALEEAIERGTSPWLVIRSGTASVNEKLAEVAAARFEADPRLGLVTAHVAGISARESFPPLGLDGTALCALDLSGLAHGAVVRRDALRGLLPLADLASHLSAAAGWTDAAWLLAAALAAAGWGSLVVPEPWIEDGHERAPYAIGPAQHATRVAVVHAFPGLARQGAETAGLLATVLPARGK